MIKQQKKKKKERKIWSIYREVLSVTWPNFTVVKYNSEISIVYQKKKKKKKWERYIKKVFYKKAVRKNFAIEEHL